MSAVSIERSTNNVNFIILTSYIFNYTVRVMHKANSVSFLLKAARCNIALFINIEV